MTENKNLVWDPIEEVYYFKSFNPDACCTGGGCYGYYIKNEPCYGESEVWDEEYCLETGFYQWVHACEGHLDFDRKYVPLEQTNDYLSN